MNQIQDDSLRLLIFRLMDGDLTAEEFLQLEEYLLHDAGALEFFVHEIDLLGNLYWDNCLGPAAAMAASELRLGKPVKLAGRGVAAAALLPDKAVPGEAPPANHDHSFPPSVLGFLSTTAQLSAHWLSTPKVLAMAVVGSLATYFVGLMISIAITRAFLADHQVDERAESTAAAPARIVSASKCRWRDRSPRADRVDILPAGTSHLDSGTVELEFDGGARVIIEGPAEFATKSSRSMELVRGRLAAYVPKHARGFTVYTPTAEIIDLGTEFDVEVARAGETRVEVRRGRVDVRGANGTRLAPRDASTLSSGEAITLSAGQAMRIDKAGDVQRVRSDAARFTRLSPLGVDTPVRKTTPNQLVGLRLWLRADQGVETDSEGLVQTWFDRSANGFAAAQAEPARRPRLLDAQAGPGFPVIAFDGADDYLDCSSPLGLDMTTDLTLFVVFQIPEAKPLCGIFSVRDKEYSDWNSFAGLAFCQTAFAKSLRVVQGECARFGPPVPKEHDSLSFETAFGDTPDGIPLVAMLSKGNGRATLWLNSEQIGADRYAMDFPQSIAPFQDVGFLLGARADSTDGHSRAGTSHFGNVQIAEIVLYRRTLSEEETLQIDRYLSTKYLSRGR